MIDIRKSIRQNLVFNCIFVGLCSYLLILASSPLLACPSCADKLQSPMDPHWPGKGPYFEGWYTKVDNGSTSIAVIVGGILEPASTVKASLSAASGASNRWRGQVTVIFKTEQGMTRVASIYPDDLLISKRSPRFSLSGSHPSLSPQFEVHTPDGRISFSPDVITIRHPELCDLHIEREGPIRPWSSKSPFGPEGFLSRSSLLKSHWYVHNLGSSSRYSINWGGIESKGRGMLHQEKNWGTTFPSSWVWLQASDPKQKKHLVFAGGDMSSSIPVPIKVWAFKYHSPGHSFEFNPAISGINASFETDCKSWFNFTAKRPGKELRLQARADPETFVPVDVVLDQNWVKGARESFHTLIDFTFERWGVPAYRSQFDGGALEFGGFCKPGS